MAGEKRVKKRRNSEETLLLLLSSSGLCVNESGKTHAHTHTTIHTRALTRTQAQALTCAHVWPLTTNLTEAA